jgi:RNA polymerase sigma-70 factor (ECF subfamily)
VATAVNPSEANRLARICAYSTDDSEWERFVRTVSPVVALAARRIGANWGDFSSNTASEVVQEVFLKLCDDDRRILREFEDRGNDSFLKLLRMITASVGTDYFRRLRAEKRGGRAVTASLDEHCRDVDFADSRALSALEWPALMGQLDRLLAQFPNAVSGRDRTVFWLYYRHGFTAEAISRIPDIGLGAKGVESAILRMTRLLRERISGGGPQTASNSPPRTDPKPVRTQKGFVPAIAIDSMKQR